MPSPRLIGSPRAASALACSGSLVAVSSFDAPSITVWECTEEERDGNEVAPLCVFTVRGSRCLLLALSPCARELWTLSDESIQAWRLNESLAWDAFYEASAAPFVASGILRCASGGASTVCGGAELSSLRNPASERWNTCKGSDALIMDAQFVSLPGVADFCGVAFVTEDGACNLWDTDAAEILCRIADPLLGDMPPTSLAVWDGALCVVGDEGNFALVEVRKGAMTVYDCGSICAGRDAHDTMSQGVTGAYWQNNLLLLSFASRVVLYDTTAGRILSDERLDEDHPEIGSEEDSGEERESEEANQETETLSVFPSADPPETSALRSVSRNSLRLQESGRAAPKRREKSLNKPVTFHKSIKSSGYGTPPQVRTLFKTAKQERNAKSKNARASRGVTEALRSRAGGPPSYPCDCTPVSEKLAVPSDVEAKMKHQGAVLKVKYSLDGSLLGSCGSDNAVRVTRLPLSKHKGDGSSFIGHHAKVDSIDFSFLSNLIRVTNIPSRPLLLTGCADGSAMLWSTALAHPLAVFAPEAKSNGSASSSNNTNGGKVQASFFYLDQFVLVSHGSMVRMHRYEIDERAVAPSRDVDTQREKNRQKVALHSGAGSANQKVVASWDCSTEAKSVNGFAAMNAFHSHLVLLSRSDGSVAAIDVAADRILRVSRGLSRAPHTITLPTHALHAAHPPGAFDMFVTSSTADGGTLQMWDLRQREAVQTLQGHQNRVHTVGTSISPCMRYIATGSEDNSCYLYDVRMGSVQSRLWQPHKDTVSDVSFHPVVPYLATACHDGRIRIFGS
ncbi:WD repeat-containing protein 27 [Hondaea fermentalgiana]|uniref:WD repeat-containing protein 27 n=1 Tax=Hondaea fermentalgiana TaxID=2315210 RepID=A0A2R5G8T1_9STRA|nr:WD repeat-containing protein 27 [Hondaea fermentalgiana]|eukprot:GBG27462.1 WD repeat-containing protein 27 [Hondaea fermentalgiana]